MSKKIVVGFVSVMLLVGLFGFGVVNYASAQNLTFAQIIDILIAIGVIPADKIAAARAAVANISVTGASATTPATAATANTAVANTTPIQCSASDFKTDFNTTAVRFNLSDYPGGNFRLVSAGNGQTGADYKTCRIWVDYSVPARQLANGSFVGPGTRNGSTLGFGSQTTITGNQTNQPSITVSSPNGGESYKAGDTVSLRLITANVPANTSSVIFQLSYFTTNATSRMEDVINTYQLPVTDGLTQWTWTIPTKYASGYVPGGFRIRAILAGPNIPSTNPPEDVSDSSFTITAPQTTPSLSASCTASPSASVNNITWNVSATGGSGSYSYSWTAYNDVAGYVNGSTMSSGFTNQYSSSGSKSAFVRVTDGSGKSTSATCSGTIVAPQTIQTVPSCILTSDKVSYILGDTIAFSWTSQNTAYASWQQDTSGKDHLSLSGDKLAANGSQSVIANIIGNPSATILVSGYGGNASCSKTINVVAPTTVQTAPAPATPVVTGPTIVSFSVLPASVNRGDNVTWSGSATTRTGYCITKHRAIVENSATPTWAPPGRWADVGCVQSLPLSSTASTAVNTYSFYEGATKYSVIWEIWDSGGGSVSKTQDVYVNPVTSMNTSQSNLGNILISFDQIMKLLNVLR